MIQFKAKKDTDPSKLASAIAHNIKNSDIEIACSGPNAVNATIKSLIIAKKYTQNEDFKLHFDFFSVQEVGEDDQEFTITKVEVSKEV